MFVYLIQLVESGGHNNSPDISKTMINKQLLNRVKNDLKDLELEVATHPRMHDCGQCARRRARAKAVREAEKFPGKVKKWEAEIEGRLERLVR